MKKIICLIMALVLVLGVTGYGCKKDKKDKYASRPKTVNFITFTGGYGEEYIEAVAKYYMDNVDKDTYINITHTVTPTEEGAKVVSNLSEADLLNISYMLFRSTGYLNELTDLYNEKVYGEDKTLGEKVDQELKAFYKEDPDLYEDGGDHWFQVPTGNNCGMSFAYNKTTLDNLFGKDNYVIPRTTEELFEFGDKLKEKATYLLTLSLMDGVDYTQYLHHVLLAQMLGYEVRQNVYNGKYFDDQRNLVLQENADFLGDERIETAVESVYDFYARLFPKEKGYCHKDSNSMRFQEAQATLCGLPFGNNQAKVAMMFNGSWLENEMEYILDEAEADDGYRQEIRYAKVPVMSDIVKRVDFDKKDMTDNELRECISYIDNVDAGKSATRPNYLNDNDLKILSEARHMVATCMISSYTIPSTSKNVRGAKDFILFCASDKAQEIALKETNGLVVLPYGKYTTEDVEVTPFNQDVLDMTKTNIPIDHGNGNLTFYQVNSVNLMYNGYEGGLVANYFAGYYKQQGFTESKQFYDKMVNFYQAKDKWPSMVRYYKDSIRK